MEQEIDGQGSSTRNPFRILFYCTSGKNSSCVCTKSNLSSYPVGIARTRSTKGGRVGSSPRKQPAGHAATADATSFGSVFVTEGTHYLCGGSITLQYFIRNDTDPSLRPPSFYPRPKRKGKRREIKTRICAWITGTRSGCDRSKGSQ